MSLDQLNHIVATMQLLNHLADTGDLPAHQVSVAVLALGDCMGCQRYEHDAVPLAATAT